MPLKRLFALVLFATSFAGACPQAAAQTTVFSCGTGGTPWNATTGTCGISGVAPGTPPGTTGYNFAVFGSNSGVNIASPNVILQPAAANHLPTNLDWTSGAVSVTAFTTHFQWTPNNWNLAFILNNATHNAGSGAAPGFTISSSFNGGAGCEGGFYQAFGGAGNPPPNNIFALDFENNNLLTNTITPFYSNVQLYQQVQSPCIPDDSQPWFYYTNKVSTSPVPLTSPAGTYQTTTGHTYDATIIYTGNAVTVNLFDVTAGGTCSPVSSSTCFTYTWPNVSIPAWVDGTTAWVNLGAATNGSSSNDLAIPEWSYSTLSAASTPTFSPSAGTYSSTQAVTISSPSGATICYNTTGDPLTDGNGNCINSTKYTGAISVPKGQTLYAVAGSGSSTYGDSAMGTAAYKITGFASQPTFNQPGGTWQGNQTVQLATAAGGVICYNTSGSPATNGSTGCTTGTLYATPVTVSANETLYAVAGGTGFTDSAISSAAFVISPFAVVAGFTGSYPSNSPTFSPVPGTYSGTQSVTLSSTTSGANICYVASSTPPTLLPTPNNLGGCAVGTLYSSAISVSSSETIYASAGTTVAADVAGTGPSSSVSSGAYTISSGGSASTPTFSPVAGTYTGTQSVTVSTTSSGAVICYNTTGSPATNGSTGCTTGTLYSGPVSVSTSETLYAIAGGTGYTDSSLGSAAYTIKGNTPTFSPLAGGYVGSQNVTISTTSSGAVICYNTTGGPATNGSTGCATGTLYTGPVTVPSSESLYAVAGGTGYSDSTVGSAGYVVSSSSSAPAVISGKTIISGKTGVQ